MDDRCQNGGQVDPVAGEALSDRGRDCGAVAQIVDRTGVSGMCRREVDQPNIASSIPMTVAAGVMATAACMAARGRICSP